MIIQFKSAPELGRLRVVSDSIEHRDKYLGCYGCALYKINYGICHKIPCNTENGFHFEQVNPND